MERWRRRKSRERGGKEREEEREREREREREGAIMRNYTQFDYGHTYHVKYIAL